MRNKGASGFTLIELSVVLVIVALITGMGLVATLGAVEAAKRSATENKMDAIEKALQQYRDIYNSLPCPADNSLAFSNANFGVQAANPGYCFSSIPGTLTATRQPTIIGNTIDVVAEGGVPVKALNLPNDFTYDGWGRRFTYTVMAAYTSKGVFTSMHPREYGGINVLTSANVANTRSTNAIYVLLSHGSNGHGAYLANGTVVNGSSTNTAEQYNCHCNSSATAISPSVYSGMVQMEYTEDPTTSTNKYDDIVRFKERWQMQNYEDANLFDKFQDIQMLIGYAYTGTHWAAEPYRRRADSFADLTLTGTAPSTSLNKTVSYVGLSQDNKMLFMYSVLAAASTTSVCEAYTVNGTALTAATAPSGCSALTYSSTNAVAWSNNGYLAISDSTAASKLTMWKYYNGAFNLLPITLTAPSAKPTKIAMSRNAENIVLSDGSTYANLYTFNNNRFTFVTNPTDWISAPGAIAFSKDGKFFAASTAGTLRLWRYVSPKDFNSDGSFGTSFDIATGFAGVGAITFSPDGNYLAVASSGTNASLLNLIKIYKIDIANSYIMTGAYVYVFTPVTLDVFSTYSYTATAAIKSLEFTPDSRYLVAIEASSANNETKKVAVFKRQDTPLRFSYHVGVDAVPGTAIPNALALYH